MITDRALLKAQALELVLSASHKMSPAELEKLLVKNFSLTKKQVKQMIRELIASEELVYTYQHGNTFLERSFEKPVRISTRIILAPPGRSYLLTGNDIIVRIAGGASFGTGTHPTTRLCLRAMDEILTESFVESGHGGNCLDVGTGTGVLVIAAVKLGMVSGVGVDIDPMALAEARQNVQLNRLQDNIAIEDSPLETLDKRFGLITANLRYPTLSQLKNKFNELLYAGGCLVVSGFKSEEQADIETDYTGAGFDVLQRETENGWCCMALKKVERH